MDETIMEAASQLDELAEDLIQFGMRLHFAARNVIKKGADGRVIASLSKRANKGKYAKAEIRKILRLLESTLDENQQKALARGRRQRVRDKERQRQWQEKTADLDRDEYLAAVRQDMNENRIRKNGIPPSENVVSLFGGPAA